MGWALLWLLQDQSILLQGALAAVLMILACWSIPGAERHFQSADDSRIVIDECAGMVVALCGVPWAWGSWVAGFVGFRLLDILKPWPIGRLERWRSPWGVLLDDLVAGLATNAALQLWLSVAR